MNDRVFLDTNVLVYAYDLHDSVKHQRAQSIVQDLTRKREAVMSAQVLGEFFVTITRKIKKRISAEDAAAIIRIYSPLDLVDIDRSLVEAAIAMHLRHQISYWDGLIIAAAERAGCSKVLSEDLSDGQQYGSVKVENPFRVGSTPT